MKTKWLGILGFVLLMAGHQQTIAQKSRLHVLTYKYAKGDKQRVSTSTYRNFTTTSPVYKNSVYGETAFDVYEEILDSREELYTMACTFELTRLTRNGENLTYKLARLFKDDVMRLTVDRYGVVDTASVRYENTTGRSKGSMANQTNIVRNFFVPLPDHPVKVGDQWKVTDYYSFDYLSTLVGDVRLSQPTVRGAYTLESVDRNRATISLNMEFGGRGDLAEGTNAFGVEFFILVKGEFVLNLTEGKLVSGTLNADVAGLGELNRAEVQFKGSQTTSFNVELLE